MYIGFGVSGRKGGGIQAPGFRPPDSGPRPQDSGPRIQAPGPRLQPPRGAVLAWFECSFVRTYARMYMRTRVEGPGSWVGYALFVGSHWFLLSVSYVRTYVDKFSKEPSPFWHKCRRVQGPGSGGQVPLGLGSWVLGSRARARAWVSDGLGCGPAMHSGGEVHGKVSDLRDPENPGISDWRP